MADLIIISGCSGGGKSSLIDYLQQAKESVIEEPGRRVIAAEQAAGGKALPWLDMTAFLRQAIALSREDISAADKGAGRIFLDRGLVDAAVAWEHLSGEPATDIIGAARFHPMVFLAPPWPEIYRPDADRRHALTEAIIEYERLYAAYPRLGYTVRLLPKASVADRAAFIRTALTEG